MSSPHPPSPSPSVPPFPRSKVYRGLGRMLLPRAFWVPHGDPAWRGGVERAFMSPTADKDVALFYANGKGTVVEISVGRVQIGGDVSFLSMVHPPFPPRRHSFGPPFCPMPHRTRIMRACKPRAAHRFRPPRPAALGVARMLSLAL